MYHTTVTVLSVLLIHIEFEIKCVGFFFSLDHPELYAQVPAQTTHSQS